MVATEETSFALSFMKIPNFNRMNRSKYQDWADDLFKIIQFHDLEEYVESGWKDIYIITKIETYDLKV